ncbi:hypothetical protein H5410_050116 [Solanum commersonii]|uniref:Uncharacterized protein n=1 Tax=Solanum commersonii TaxID=4109 RepID=A0A9J5WUJ9_SOLCO|nr:hypothetical protein H5410_050116 [Solanum commersonii]
MKKVKVIKSFRFLNFWIEQESFQEVVRQNWSGNFGTDPFYILHNKLEKVSKAISKWSKDTYGDIFRKIATLEEVNISRKLSHMFFLQSPAAQFIWRQFSGPLGLNIQGLQVINLWWEAPANQYMRGVYCYSSDHIIGIMEKKECYKTWWKDIT